MARLAAYALCLLLFSACAKRGELREIVAPTLEPTPQPTLEPTPRAGAQRLSRTAKPARAKPKKDLFAGVFPRLPNSAFAPGEKLTFAVQYFNITGGYATLSISATSDVRGRLCYPIVAEARTHPAFESIIKVRDRIVSYIDKESLVSWGYEKHIREGGFAADAEYEYDPWACEMREPAKYKRADIPVGTQDVLSCFYYFRTLDLKVGQPVYINVTADDMKNYELKVDVVKKEKIKTLAGEFNCLLVEPHLKFKGVFQQKGRVLIWLTDDERKIPVLIKSKIAIGSININLQDAEWVKPN